MTWGALLLASATLSSSVTFAFSSRPSIYPLSVCLDFRCFLLFCFCAMQGRQMCWSSTLRPKACGTSSHRWTEPVSCTVSLMVLMRWVHEVLLLSRFYCTTLLSHGDFSDGKFRSHSQGKACRSRVTLPQPTVPAEFGNVSIIHRAVIWTTRS